MSYIPTKWKNREVERPRTYTMQDNGDGSVTLIPAEGAVIEPGTPIIASNMNNIEEGLKQAHNVLDNLSMSDEGILTIPGQTYFFASTSNSISIANGVDTKITPQAKSGDQHNELINGIWTVKETGVYFISASVRWTTVINGIGTFKLYSGGSSALNMDLGSNAKLTAFGRPVMLTAGTQLTPYISQDSGASVTMDRFSMYIAKIS